MTNTNDMPTITAYRIEGAAGCISKGGLTHHDVQATAWAALGAVTASRWERIEVRQLQAGVFEVEGRIGPDERSGVYLLTLGEVHSRLCPIPSQRSDTSTQLRPAGRRFVIEETEDRPMRAHNTPTQRVRWADWVPAAPAVLTRAELITAVNGSLNSPISASAIAEWERAGILPIPMGDPATRSYPEAAQQLILLLISLQQDGRAHLDILEVLRNTARDLAAVAAPAVAHPLGG